MNPCPCGYLGDVSGRCRCTPDRVARYRTRVSGPLLDRIDLRLEVPQLLTGELAGGAEAAAAMGADSAAVRARVVAACGRQRVRQGTANARLAPADVARHCAPDAQGEALLAKAAARLALSARGYHRVLKVARTIADLAGADAIAPRHLAEAIGYRQVPAP